ncbi:MAG: class II fructose-bisphosphate aldolase [Candidatus Bipolaricaulota bacterium]
MPFCGGSELHDAYKQARRGGYAYMANNIAEPNTLIGLLEAYTAAGSDLLVQISPGAAKYAGAGDKMAGLRVLSGLVKNLAAPRAIRVFVNLDHFTRNEMELIQVAIDERLVSSIMIDASHESFEENARISREVVERARGSGILVEAELGKIRGVEDEISSDDAFYTQPDEAVEFVRSSGADLLAISIGTEHGVSKGRKIRLRVDLAKAIQERLAAAGLETPLVLHGSSGLLIEQVREVIRYGVCKLNKDTHYQYVYSRAACEFYVKHAASILPPAGVEDDVVDLFAGGEWSPDKKHFDPRVAGREVQERIRWIAGELLKQAGSAGHGRTSPPPS